MIQRKSLLSCAVLFVLIGGAVGWAETASTQPAADVMALVNQMDAVYSKLQTAEFDGHVVGHFDIAGQTKSDDITFTSVFRSPNFFKHVAQGDVILGSTGRTAYAYEPSHNTYISADAPVGRGSLNEWPSAIPGILQQQNPSMLLALTQSPAAALKDLGREMIRLPDTQLEGVGYPTLQLGLPDHEVVTMLIDPKNSLLRQVRFDLRKMMEDRGAVDVKAAEVTVDYTKAVGEAASDEKTFAWNPPPGAIVAAAAAAAGEEEDAAALALVGKGAPDFTLPGLDEKPVKLSALKGSVVLLNFWGVTCPPCLAELPELDQLNKNWAARGLKFLAIDQFDDRDAVKAVIQEGKISLPILLDPLGDVGKAYGVVGIPVTVLIGKDGIIKKVFLGAQVEEIKSAVEKEMGG